MHALLLTLLVMASIPAWLRPHLSAQRDTDERDNIIVVVPVFSGECVSCSVPTRSIIETINHGAHQRRRSVQVFSVVHTPRKVEMDYMVSQGRTFGNAILDPDGSICRSLRGKDRTILAVAYYGGATVVLRKPSDVREVWNVSR